MLEAALCHVLVLLQVPVLVWDPGPGSLVSDCWGLVKPEPRLSAGSLLYQVWSLWALVLALVGFL